MARRIPQKETVKAFHCMACGLYGIHADATVGFCSNVTLLRSELYVNRSQVEEDEISELTCRDCGGRVELVEFARADCPHNWIVEAHNKRRKCWVCERVEYAKEVILVFEEESDG